jgi:class 3 adenylate cyclase
MQPPVLFSVRYNETPQKLGPGEARHLNARAGADFEVGWIELIRSAREMPPVRRLTAILVADVAAYSRLMGADEEGTHERLIKGAGEFL